MTRHVCCLLAMLLTLPLSLSAHTDHLAASEIARLKNVCRDLVGSQFPYDDLPWQRSWQRLRPYLRSKNAVYQGRLVCSGGCSGSVPLRGGLHLNFTFPNPQKFGERWGPHDGVIDSVTLSDGTRDLAHYPNKT